MHKSNKNEKFIYTLYNMCMEMYKFACYMYNEYYIFKKLRKATKTLEYVKQLK